MYACINIPGGHQMGTPASQHLDDVAVSKLTTHTPSIVTARKTLQHKFYFILVMYLGVTKVNCTLIYVCSNF